MKIIITLGSLFVVFALGLFLVVNYTPFLSGDSIFVKNCESLNGQELKLSNIKKLNGWCHTSAERRQCTEDHIKRLTTGTDPFHNISEKPQIQNTWECSISRTEDNKIKAKPQYNYE